LKVLIDTSTFISVNFSPEGRPAKARNVRDDPDNEVWLSAVSGRGDRVKNSLGRLPMAQPATSLVPQCREIAGVESLPLTEEEATQESKLPRLYADTFDRVLIAQPLTHGIIILTPDEEIARYPVRVIW
jgi:PIN domain nuclease of toxin-antitoxin system